MNYYVIENQAGPYRVSCLSASEIVDRAQAALYARGSCLEERAGVPYVLDSDGDVTLGRGLGAEEAVEHAVKYFQGFDVYEAYPVEEAGEFLWHAQRRDLEDAAWAVVREQDPWFAAMEFGVN
jgi:hypothetical protein